MARRTGVIFPLLLILSIAGCANTPIDTGAAARVTASPTIAATPAPTLSISQLLSGVLSSLLAGNYEEAILAYTAIIEIEPKNFDAHLGLGKSYRAAKQPQNAVTALETARNLRTDDRDMLVELGNAYLDVGSYALAEGVARPLWESATPDMDAGVVLLLSLLAQERTEDAQAMMQDEAFAGYWYGQVGGDVVYFGEYNEAGDRHGKGICIYDGFYLYIGDYENDMRSGQGTWQIALSSAFHFMGEWKNDAPNGYGEFRPFYGSLPLIVGTFLDGLEHGQMQVTETGDDAFCSYLHEYTAENGKRTIVERPQANVRGGIYALCMHDGYLGGWALSDDRIDIRFGVPGWCDEW